VNAHSLGAGIVRLIRQLPGDQTVLTAGLRADFVLREFRCAPLVKVSIRLVPASDRNRASLVLTDEIAEAVYETGGPPIVPSHREHLRIGQYVAELKLQSAGGGIQDACSRWKSSLSISSYIWNADDTRTGTSR